MSFTINFAKSVKSSDGSILGKVKDFQSELLVHEQMGYNMYKKNPMLSSCDREVSFFNRHTRQEENFLMFGSNSYLGASTLQRAVKKSIEVTSKLGIGSGGVPLLSGTTMYQRKLEERISNFIHFDDTILFSSGYTANLGIITGLLRPCNLIVHDKLNHASLIDASILSGAKMLRYKHNDIKSLENILVDNYQKYPSGILVVTDGVFSMDGDIANLPHIIEVVNKYNALLLIDEAHATGVIGVKGKGTLSHFGITDTNNIIITGTLSKAIGMIGGYISANQEIIDYLRIYARSNMFSASLPPNICAAAIEVFNELDETDLVKTLSNNAAYMKERFKNEGFNTLNTETAIIPIIVGDPELLTKMSKDFNDVGIMINPIFPPAVPPNLTRFRISVMANHKKSDMDFLVDTMVRIFEKYNLKRNI